MRNVIAVLTALAFATLLYPTDGFAGPADKTAVGYKRGHIDVSKIPQADYALDPAHASIHFDISHLGFSHYRGRFDKFNATLKLTPQQLEKSALTVTINASSIDTNNATLEDILRSADFFNVAKYPDISFTLSKLEKTGDTTARLTGDLTLLGVTKPITLDVVLVGCGFSPLSSDYIVGFSAQGAFKRSDFGMTHLIPLIGDTVGLTIEAEFIKVAGKTTSGKH